ncbi:hypothetical protein [Clostridium estertheticum]|nr:hypothetical protein [Clostridium estertheticum]
MVYIVQYIVSTYFIGVIFRMKGFKRKKPAVEGVKVNSVEIK